MSSTFLPPKLTAIPSRKEEKANSISKPLYHLDSPHAGPEVSQLDHRTQATQHELLRKKPVEIPRTACPGRPTAGGQAGSAILNSGMEVDSKRRPIHISGSTGVPAPCVTGSGG